MRRSHRQTGFTLVELLVVIGIIALLIAMLLPALTRARDQANTVYCASQMRQVYTAMEQYTASERNYVMPASAGTGSAVSYNWWGIDVLGKGYGVKRLRTNNGTQQNLAVQRIMKLLNCPSVNRPDPEGTGSSGDYYGDYTYNGNLGDFRYYVNGSAGANNGEPDATNVWTFAQFKKRNQVPANVLVLVDLPDIRHPNDDRFGTLENLVTASGTSRPLPLAGRPHQNKKKANCLFMDGSVRLVKAFDPGSGSPAPAAVIPGSTQLENWMIKSSFYLKGPANQVNRGSGSPQDMWQKGRPLPF